MKRCLFCVFAILVFGFSHPGLHGAEAPQSPRAAEQLDAALHEQIVKIPMTTTSVFGEKQINLTATIFKPDGPGPFPLLVLSHGAPRDGDNVRAGMKRSRFHRQSREFVKLGFAVAVPMRRGYGPSEGAYAEGTGSCRFPRYHSSGLESAKDLRAAVDYMKKLPYVNGSKIVLAGQSAGGFASIAAAGTNIAGVRGVLNFAGGRGSAKPDFVCEEHLLVEAFRKFGETSRVPTLWIYSENDHYFSPRLVKKMAETYSAAGGRVKLAMKPPFGDDGHLLFSKEAGIPIWLPEAAEFLQSLL